MHSKAISILVMFFCFAASVRAQEGRGDIELLFLDSLTGKSIPQVSLMYQGRHVATGNTDGILVISDSSFTQNVFTIFKEGYHTLQVSRIPNNNTVYLKPLQYDLGEVVIVSGSRIAQAVKRPNDYILDYLVLPENILAISYSSDFARSFKIMLANKATGEVIAGKTIVGQPVRLFKSCVQQYYLLTTDKLYPVSLLADTIAIAEPYDKRVALMLAECQLYVQNMYYYKFKDPSSFKVVFASMKQGDTLLKPFKKFEKKEIADASNEELRMILMKLEQLDRKGAARLAGLRNMWDRSSMKFIDVDIHAVRDKLTIFDFERNLICFYDLEGNLLREVPIQFTVGRLLNLSIIKDPVSEKLYLYRPRFNTIEEIDLNTGHVLGNKVILEKNIVSNVQVYDGEIYFLWQDKANAAPMQLFVQRQ